MTCKTHPKYQGKRIPQIECNDCWIQYFETDTENKKNKYPDQYKKYIEKKKHQPPVQSDIEKPKEESPIHRDKKNNIAANIPIVINNYFYSTERLSTLKLVGFNNDSLIFIEDHKLIVPLSEIESLHLVPQSETYFVYSTKRTPVEAQNKTMRVFPKESSHTIVDVQDPSKIWKSHDVSWSESDKLVVEDFPKDKSKHTKQKRKKSSE